MNLPTPQRMRRGRQEGLAMLLVLGFLAALMIGSSAFYGLLNQTLSETHAREKDMVCLNLAEAGLDMAIAELQAHPSGYNGERDTALGAGFFTVEVSEADNGKAAGVTSTGFLRDGGFVLRQARIVAEVSLAPDGGVKQLRWSEGRP